MVRWALKPSLREASCCRVEVVKGGGGLRRAGFFSTDLTVNWPVSTARLASVGFVGVAEAELVQPLAVELVHQRARKGSEPAETSASTVQYSCALNASISISRSTTRRRATDCTRPADREPGSLRHSTGERVKPTR